MTGGSRASCPLLTPRRATCAHPPQRHEPLRGFPLAERLSLHYVDQELVSRAALRYGLLEQKLSNLDEAKPSLFDRFDAETRRYITLLQTTLYEFAEKGRVVLMGEVPCLHSTRRVPSAPLMSIPPRQHGGATGVIHVVHQSPSRRTSASMFLLSFGGKKDGAGAFHVGRVSGLDALAAFLLKLGVSQDEPDTALQVLSAQPHHQILNVTLTKEFLRTLGS